MTTWTPATQQTETWTSESQAMRAFDPAAFENNPVFDTGTSGGVWVARTQQAETWVGEP